MYGTYDDVFAALHGTERSLKQNKNHDHSAFTSVCWKQSPKTIPFGDKSLLDQVTTETMNTQYSRTRTIRRREQGLARQNSLSLLLLSLLLVTFLGSKTVDASYAISINPGTEECYIFMTPGDVATTSTVT